MYPTAFLRISLFILTLAFGGCIRNNRGISLPYYNTPDFTPIFGISPDQVKQKIPHTISAFSLTNQYGQSISDEVIEGKVHAANFIFTRCGSICPVMTKHMKWVDQAFQNDPRVVILSYSVTPWIDSVGQLRKYTAGIDIHSSNWHFLTGNKSEIYTLARQSYFAEEDLGFTRDSSEFLHTEHVLLIDQTKRIRGIYNGTLALEMEQLIKDMRLLLME